MVMKEYSAFPKDPVYCSLIIRLLDVISKILVEGAGLTPLQRCSQCTLQPKLTGLSEVLVDGDKIILPLLYIKLRFNETLCKVCEQRKGLFWQQGQKISGAEHGEVKDGYFWWAINQKTNKKSSFLQFNKQCWSRYMMFIHSSCKEFSWEQ